MIIDFDVHHGNGTSDAFYDDPDIFFLSTHQVLYSCFLCLWHLFVQLGVELYHERVFVFHVWCSLEATLVLVRSMKSDKVMVKAQHSTFLCLVAQVTTQWGVHLMRSLLHRLIEISQVRSSYPSLKSRLFSSWTSWEITRWLYETVDLLRNELVATNIEVRREWSRVLLVLFSLGIEIQHADHWTT